MTNDVCRVFSELAGRQHGVAAVWQLCGRGFRRTAIDRWIRLHRPPRVHRGVYGRPTDLGRLMAAVLAAGPGAALSHRFGAAVWGMREIPSGPVSVSVTGTGGRTDRSGFRVHRVRPFAIERSLNIPVTSPTRCLVDARLPRHEAYRALEYAEVAGL